MNIYLHFYKTRSTRYECPFWGRCHAFDRLAILGCDLMWLDEVIVVTKFRLYILVVVLRPLPTVLAQRLGHSSQSNSYVINVNTLESSRFRLHRNNTFSFLETPETPVSIFRKTLGTYGAQNLVTATFVQRPIWPRNFFFFHKSNFGSNIY